MIYLFYFFILMLPLEYLQEKIPKGPAGINYLNVTFFLMATWWLVRGSRNGRRWAMPSSINVALLAYIVYSYLGMFITAAHVPGYPLPLNTDHYVMLFIRMVNGMFFFWIAANMIDTRRHMRWALYAVAASMLLVYRAFRSDAALHSLASFSNKLRFSGPFVYLNSNELAAMFLYGCIFFGLYALSQSRRREKFGFLFVAALYGYGLLYSYSRGAQLAMIVVVALVVSLRYRWMLVVFLIAAVTYRSWVPNSVIERWEMTETEDGQLESSAQSRKDFWALAMELFHESPVVGHGYQSFKHLNPDRMDTHNVYMRVLAEQGIVGAVIFMSIWICLLRLSFQVWRRGPTAEDRQYGFALFAATIGLMIANIFGDRFTHQSMIGHFWLLVGLCQRLHANMTGYERFEDETLDVTPEDAGAASLDGARPMRPVLVSGGPVTAGMPFLRRPYPPVTPPAPPASSPVATPVALRVPLPIKGNAVRPRLNVVGRDPQPGPIAPPPPPVR